MDKLTFEALEKYLDARFELESAKIKQSAIEGYSFSCIEEMLVADNARNELIELLEKGGMR